MPENAKPSPKASPTQIDKFSPFEMFIAWNNGEQYSLPFLEIRYHCPCASCVDEHTGKRTIQRDSIKPEIRPVKVDLVGRYAVHLIWSDGHQTGIYHYETLNQLCRKYGKRLNPNSVTDQKPNSESPSSP